MDTVRARHSAGRGSFVKRPAGSASHPRHAQSRSDKAKLYGDLNEAFCQYTHDVPEAPFPTFLESLLFEHFPAERSRRAH